MGIVARRVRKSRVIEVYLAREVWAVHAYWLSIRSLQLSCLTLLLLNIQPVLLEWIERLLMTFANHSVSSLSASIGQRFNQRGQEEVHLARQPSMHDVEAETGRLRHMLVRLIIGERIDA